MFADRTNHARLAEQTNARFAAAQENPGRGSDGSRGQDAVRGLTPKPGHNNPPGVIDSAKEALTELNAFLTDNPVIENHDQAKQAGGWIERTRVSLKSLEDERSEKVSPLNTLLKNINDTYRAAREPLEKVLLELKRRVTAYTTAEENKRKAEAERLRIEAEAAKHAAAQAALAADEAIAEADVGVCSDVGSAIADADAAIRAAGKLNRAAARAEREQNVRIGSVMGGKALSLRTVEVLTVTDAAAAIKCMGLTDKIRDAIVTSARAYREDFGDLPDGVTATKDRRM